MGNCKVFVGGLSYSTDEESLANFFESHLAEMADGKKIINLRIVRDHATGDSKGFAFVTFLTSDMAQKALELDGSKLDGRIVGVKEAVDRRR